MSALGFLQEGQCAAQGLTVAVSPRGHPNGQQGGSITTWGCSQRAKLQPPGRESSSPLPCCLQKAPGTEQGSWSGGAACCAAAEGRGEAERPVDLHASLTSSPPPQLLLLCDISNLIKSRKSVIINSCSVASETATASKAAMSWP